MTEMKYLSLEELLMLCGDLGVGPVRDHGLLESALARPQTTVMGSPAYPDLSTQAAALLHSLVCNHALVDGNKRLGWLATVVFVADNGFRVALSQEQAFDLVMAVADGTLQDVADIAARLPLAPRG